MSKYSDQNKEKLERKWNTTKIVRHSHWHVRETLKTAGVPYKNIKVVSSIKFLYLSQYFYLSLLAFFFLWILPFYYLFHQIFFFSFFLFCSLKHQCNGFFIANLTCFWESRLKNLFVLHKNSQCFTKLQWHRQKLVYLNNQKSVRRLDGILACYKLHRRHIY